MRRRIRALASAVVLGAGVMAAGVAAPAVSSPSVDATYTTSADFARGTFVNTNATTKSGQIQLNTKTSTFKFIWIALSARGTVAKIDTETGTVLGEYSTTSDGDDAHNPSRTTVALDGSVFAGNRNQSSVIHVGLPELNQCVDRNSNGAIDTSTGYGDVKPWPGGSYGATAAVSAAQDECILHYVDTYGGDARSVAVNADGDVWVGNYSGSPHRFQKIDGTTGTIVSGSEKDFACGGYGALIDGNGVLWSSNSGGSVLRWDPAAPDADGVNPKCIAIPNYGIAVDSQNNIWVGSFDGTGLVRKLANDGSVIAAYAMGHPYAQGLAVDHNDHVWISSSLSGGANQISHLKNDGTLLGLVTTQPGGIAGGNGSTGVAVDAAGKIWLANIDSSDATRIDPTAGPLGSDGVTPLGAFDLNVALPGASPYNYSDMTGNVLLGTTAPQGTWTVVHDGGRAAVSWHTISYNNEKEGYVPPGATLALQVEARSADNQAGLGAKPYQVVKSCVVNTGLVGRYVQLRVTLKPNASGQSPILSDLVVRGGSGITPGECVPKPVGPTGDTSGYAQFNWRGGVQAHGGVVLGTSAQFAGTSTTNPIVAAAVTPSGLGYYLVERNGGVLTTGDAVFRGSAANLRLRAPIVGIALDPDGSGYWLVGADGGVFAFGSRFYGSLADMTLRAPIVGIAPERDGSGYYLAGSDGGVFALNAPFLGSMIGTRLAAPVVGIATDRDGRGYYLASADGGVFAFQAPYFGNMVDYRERLYAPISGIASDPDGRGYYLGGLDGGAFAFGAAYRGNALGLPNRPVVAIASR